jgi:hypothetical protein
LLGRLYLDFTCLSSESSLIKRGAVTLIGKRHYLKSKYVLGTYLPYL